MNQIIEDREQWNFSGQFWWHKTQGMDVYNMVLLLDTAVGS
jgi:hypothetical protein